LVKEDIKSQIYGSHATVDIEATIRRSEIELANYELKQGLLTLDDKRTVDTNLIDKVVKTICAIANNGPKNVGKLIIGVTDKDSDATRIQDLDEIVAKKVGKRFVVGVNREAKVLGLSTEQYFSQWKDAIRNSALSQKLKDSVLSNIDFNAFFGLGVLVITVPAQSEPSYVADRIYFREADSTVEAVNAPQIAGIAQRFTGA
jgi:predicted HTH transcriptional regulator